MLRLNLLCVFHVALVLGCSSEMGEPSSSGTSDRELASSDREKLASELGSTQFAAHGCPGAGEQFRVATFNAALAPDFAPYVAERRPAIIDALADSAKQLDLMCVQEFWRETDFESLRNATQAELPHSLRRAPRHGFGSCTLMELGQLGQCLQSQCPDVMGAQLVECATQHCAVEVASLSGGCLGCIMNHLEDDMTVCAGAGGKGDPAIFEGAYDVGLLSRQPMIDSEVTRELDSYFVRMAVLYAEIAIPGHPHLHAFCTHLGSALGVVPYAGDHGSWESEHLHQVTQLRDYIREKTTVGDWVVVLGDMNAGPDARGLVGEWQSNYAALVSDDLLDPYLNQANVACTWCPNNTLVDDASTPRLLDHVLFGAFERPRLRVERILDRRVLLGTANGAISSHLSDHYGLRATIGWK